MIIQYWCGPSYFDKYKLTRKVKRWLSRRHNFICKIHDEKYEYEIGTRKEADKALLIGMRTNSKNLASGVTHITYILEDYIFYFLVRLIGITRWGKK